MDPELIQFRYSPYNEKVRWALDLIGIRHRRRSVLPGPHIPIVKRRTGQTSTPILRLQGRWIAGSAQIVAALDQLHPTAGLIPADPDSRARSAEIQSQFDDVFGPAIRKAVLTMTLADRGYFADMFSEGRSWPIRAAYRATIPLAAPMVRAGNGLNEPGALKAGEQAIVDALDWIEQHTRSSLYLVGDRFSIADITAACMLAAIANPPDSTMSRPQPMPAPLTEWLDRWREHAGTRWVLQMYEAHRGPYRNFEGSNR